MNPHESPSNAFKAASSPGVDLTAKLKPLIGKRVEAVRVDDYGVVFITASGLGGRIVVKIGERIR